MRNNKKYELVPNDTIKIGSITLYRIKYRRNIYHADKNGKRVLIAKAGGFGGYVEGEHNLSHYGNSAILDNAKVYGKARVRGDAVVKNSATVYDYAIVYGSAVISGYAAVYGYAKVGYIVRVNTRAHVTGRTHLNTDLTVSGEVYISLSLGTGLMLGVGDREILSSKGTRIFVENDVYSLARDNMTFLKIHRDVNKVKTFDACGDKSEISYLSDELENNVICIFNDFIPYISEVNSDTGEVTVTAYRGIRPAIRGDGRITGSVRIVNDAYIKGDIDIDAEGVFGCFAIMIDGKMICNFGMSTNGEAKYYNS